MIILGKLFKWFFQFRLNEIEYLKQNPGKAQTSVFNNLIDKAESTEWGQKYDYKSINSLEDFQKKVPISEHEDFMPYISRMMEGEKNILWPGRIHNFSKSSGTTSRSKFIPISRELLADMYKAGKDQLALYLESAPDTKILSGKSIFVGGSLKKTKEEPEIYCGDVSAILMKNMSSIWKYKRTPSLETAMLADYEIKLERLAEETINENVTSIAGVPTWTLALLRKILDKTGKDNILEVWPNFEVFFHGAVSFEPYREIFKELIPSDDVRYMEAYNASEGFFAIQDDLAKHNEMWLVPDYGIFYEFILASEFENGVLKKNPKIYTMADVEMGKDYVVIISTNSGLWRYNIGDTIRFTNLRPHRLKITGRTKHFINAFGEELMVHNADTALAKVSEAMNAKIHDYTVAPMHIENGKKGYHEWVVEFSEKPESLSIFSVKLDEVLRELNSDYDAKRHKDIILENLKVHAVPKGTFYKWMKSRGKLGGQHKVPRLSNSRDYVEEILELVSRN